jgi:hypothetical protein
MKSARNQNKANRSINLPKFPAFLADHHCARVHSPFSNGRDVVADESCRFLSIFGVISTADDRWRACSLPLPLLPMASAAACGGAKAAEAGRGGGKICASRHYSASVDSPLTEVLFLQVFFACAPHGCISVHKIGYFTN